ncbi:MAG TPA: hypothetical protein VEQ60_30540, partial [Longimicrobium sp.]|nr:hypothetical protein [Longimicrobium sp.]
GESAPLVNDPANGGFVAAPSLAHAATAAILRSGYLALGGGASSAPFAIDLSSDRVRLAEWILDGVREGQPLGALLGYRFERSLREHAELPQYTRALRIMAPLGAWYQLEADKARRIETELAALVAQQNAAQAVLQQAIDTLTAEITSLTNQINTKTTTKNSKIATRTTLQGQVATLNTEIANLQTSIDTKEAQRADALDEIDRRLRQGADPDADPIPDLMAEVMMLDNQIASLQATQTSKINTRTTKQNQIATLNTEITNLTNQITDLSGQKTTRTNTRTTKQNELNALKAAHTQARDALPVNIGNEMQPQFNAILAEYRERFVYPDSTMIEPMQTIPAQNVVDGLALLRRWRESGLPWGKGGLPAAGSQHATLLEARLAALDQALDAVGDLALAEGVHQLARGNEMRAGATLDAIARGETPPPEPEVVRTPRSGTAHVHRLAVLLSGQPAAPAAWPTDSLQRRAHAEPALNAWAATLLPDPARVRVPHAFEDAATGETLHQAMTTLDTFSLSPLDVLHLADAAEADSALEQRIGYTLLRARPTNVPADARVRIDPDRGPGWTPEEVSFGEMLEAARAARELLSAARPLDARDLAAPGESPAPGVDADELQARADAAVDAFRDAARVLRETLDATDPPATADDLRAALLRLAWMGMPAAVPLSVAGETEDALDTLRRQGDAVSADAARRVDALDAAEGAVDRAAATLEARAALDGERMKIVFGAEFRVAPRFRPADAGALAAAFAASAELQGGDAGASAAWLLDAAHVQPGAARLADALTCAEALDADAGMRLSVAQLPRREADRWVALPPDPARPADGAPRLSIVAHVPAEIEPGAPLCGLMVDEWVETVPAARETAGIAFHYDAPAAQAPHAILLAVPPDAEARWTVDTLEAVVRETLEMARLRGVDAAALNTDDSLSRGHFLPAIYLAFNREGDTVSTDLAAAAA